MSTVQNDIITAIKNCRDNGYTHPLTPRELLLELQEYGVDVGSCLGEDGEPTAAGLEVARAALIRVNN